MPRCEICELEFDPMYPKTCRGALIDYGVEASDDDHSVDAARNRARRMGMTFKSKERTVRFDNQIIFVRAWTVREPSDLPCHYISVGGTG